VRLLLSDAAVQDGLKDGIALLPLQVEESWPEGHLAALAGLSSLKVLHLTACGVRDEKTYAPGQWAFMSALTALTEAYLTVASSSDILCCGSLGGCVAMEDLIIDSLVPRARPEQAQDSLWEAIVQLTRLTSLGLTCVAQHALSPAFAAISSLSRLQILGVGSWAPAVLPVLQTLPKGDLWQLGGGQFRRGDSDRSTSCG
jgi:hypothetical protein